MLALKAREGRRGRHVRASPASLKSQAPCSSAEPGEPSLSKARFESSRRLERRLRCNLRVAPSAQWARRQRGPAGGPDPAARSPPAPERPRAAPCSSAQPAEAHSPAWPARAAPGPAAPALMSSAKSGYCGRAAHGTPGHRAEFSVLLLSSLTSKFSTGSC